MSDEIQNAIATTAAGPASASDQAGSFTAQKIADLIEADRYLSAKAAAKAGRSGIRIQRIKGNPAI